MSVLKKAIQSFDPAPEKKTEIELALNLLFELAQTKCDFFNKEISTLLRTAGSEENPTIPITQILGSQYDTRAYVSTSADNIISETTKAIKEFVTGGSDNVINGIGTLLSSGITALIGSGTGEQASHSDYFIAVDGLSIVRIDIKSWVRRINVKGITQQIEQVLAFTAVKSSVDVDKISFNTFLQAYKYQLEQSKLEQKDLLEEIKNAKEVFNLLKSDSPKLTSYPMEFKNVHYPSANIGLLLNEQ